MPIQTKDHPQNKNVTLVYGFTFLDKSVDPSASTYDENAVKRVERRRVTIENCQYYAKGRSWAVALRNITGYVARCPGLTEEAVWNPDDHKEIWDTVMLSMFPVRTIPNPVHLQETALKSLYDGSETGALLAILNPTQMNRADGVMLKAHGWTKRKGIINGNHMHNIYIYTRDRRKL